MLLSNLEPVASPVPEIERNFYHFKLGSPRGRVGRWVIAEALKSKTLWGLQRFDIVKAFTLAAQSLGHRERRRFEDAMSSYLFHAFKTRKNSVGFSPSNE